MIDSAQLSRNKEIVLDFLNTAITNREPLKAIDRYVGDVYIQHNPNFADGPDAIKAAFPIILESNPDMTIDIKKVIAEDDLVVLLIHTKMNKDE
ncbi:MAG: ester cyclase [Pseudohongiellaceae bacterium]